MLFALIPEHALNCQDDSPLRDPHGWTSKPVVSFSKISNSLISREEPSCVMLESLVEAERTLA